MQPTYGEVQHLCTFKPKINKFFGYLRHYEDRVVLKLVLGHQIDVWLIKVDYYKHMRLGQHVLH